MKDSLRGVLDAALSTGGDFAEIFLEDNRTHAIQLLGGHVETVNSNRAHGAGIRVFHGLNAVYAYTNDTDPQGLLRCARQAASAVADGGSVQTAPPLVSPQLPAPFVCLQHPSDVAGKRKVEYLRQADAAARAVSAEIEQVSCSLSDSEQEVTIVNSEGLYVEDTRIRLRMACVAIASDGKEKQQGHEAPGALMGYELFADRVDPTQVGRDAAQTAVTMLHAPECPAGVMPVVIDNGFGGVIFHEACGHSLEATSVAFGMSVFCDKLGQKIAADCVTAIDDGTLPNEWGSLRVDDEGMPTNRLVLIENGILKNYMIDRLNAKRMKMPPTGSGRRQSYALAPTSRMRNTYIAAGNDDEAAMIATMGDGLYAKKLGGGSVDPATGIFNFAVSEGYLVKDGKIVSPVRGASLIGKGADILLQIDRVGRDMKMAQGMCGSISGSIPVNVGQPMIRVKQMTVGGRA
ncbi:MAG TPA: TldD/PmbA family protein [Candidatus Limiplasma sp.]|nr:TldD/PmbA family protein [Candidatus Limiplasma sp.]